MIPRWFTNPVVAPSSDAAQLAATWLREQFHATGSLGVLEELAMRLAALRGTATPELKRVRLALFAADHGVVLAGGIGRLALSTADQVRAILKHRAAVARLAEQQGVELELVDVGIAEQLDGDSKLVSKRAGAGSSNFLFSPAMTEDQLLRALQAGREAVKRAAKVDLFIAGEVGMGGNLTAATLASAMLGIPPEAVSGPEPEHSEEVMTAKARVIHQAIDFHSQFTTTPIETLRRLGGFEIAAMCGAYITCGEKGIPILVDGFVSAVAALFAVIQEPSLKNWLIFSHRSAEPGHFSLITAMGGKPLQYLDIACGQGVGALAALPLLRQGCVLLRGAPGGEP